MKNGGIKIVISVIVLILAFVGIYLLGESDSQNEMMMEDNSMENEPELINDVDMMEDGQMEEGSMMMEYSGEVLAGESAMLLDFNQSDYEKALETDKLIVLYFYANWCPVCAEEVETALYPAFNEMERDDVIGFRVNYNDNQTDNDEEELAQEHGVAYQHTKVFVRNGERILKAPDSWDKDRYFTEINSIFN